MGILKNKKPTAEPASASKRRSVQTDFANLKPLKKEGTVGFTSFRDNNSAMGGNGKRKDDDDDMSDDDEEKPKFDTAEGEDFKDKSLSPEDAKKAGELTAGVQKIKVCSYLSHFYTIMLMLFAVETTAFF
jgi:hypothetical protein